jgi:hypothetical protein
VSGDVWWAEDAPLHDVVNVTDTGVPSQIAACWFGELVALGIANVTTDHAPGGLDP